MVWFPKENDNPDLTEAHAALTKLFERLSEQGPFKAGDTVALKAGGDRMEVESIDDNGRIVCCVDFWDYNRYPRHYTVDMDFNPADLELVVPVERKTWERALYAAYYG
jgi:uncharacterized protein YodC (DUF2158 family)